MLFENALYSEIRRFYPEEFQIGCHALDLIEERIKVRLPEDEAASIAFHLVNSEFGGMRLRDTQIMTEIIRHLIGMIRADYHFPEDLVYEDRLITNLKFMLNRLIQNKEGWITEDARFNEFVRANYRNEYELARAMRDYIESVVSCKMTEEEVIYLAVQLKYADIKKKEGKKKMEQFSMERTGSQLVLHICEELDHHTAGQISKVVDLQIEKGNVRTLIFDFSGITFMDSSGIGMVMGRHRKMNFLGGRTFVTGIGDNVDRIFRMSGLYRIIPKYQERTEVL